MMGKGKKMKRYKVIGFVNGNHTPVLSLGDIVRVHSGLRNDIAITAKGVYGTIAQILDLYKLEVI